MFDRGKLILQDYKDNCLPQISVLSEERRFLNLQEFRTRLYQVCGRNNLSSKTPQVDSWIFRDSEGWRGLHSSGRSKGNSSLGKSTLNSDGRKFPQIESKDYELTVKTQKRKKKKTTLQQHTNIRHHELRVSKNNRIRITKALATAFVKNRIEVEDVYKHVPYTRYSELARILHRLCLIHSLKASYY